MGGRKLLQKMKVLGAGAMCAVLLCACGQNNAATGESQQAPETEATQAEQTETQAQDNQNADNVQNDVQTDVTLAEGTATSDVGVEKASEKISGSIHVEKLSTGAIAYVYVPDNADYGVRATAAPILVVYGNTAYTSQTALETANTSGLAAIADKEQGAVVFVNPLGEEWSEDDKASLEAAKNLFSDGTNNNVKVSNYTVDGKSEVAAYPGSYCRVYVFGEGAGADFVYEQLSPGVDGSGQFFGNATIKPTAAFLANPASTEKVDLTKSDKREIPVVVMNGADEIASAYEALNQTVETESVTSDVKEGFDMQTLLDAYDNVVEHYMVRVQASVGVEDCQTSLLKINGNQELGLTETKNTYEFSDGTALTYYEWSDGTEGEPLVLTFHGSGNSAEMQVWSSGLNALAASEGFQLVSFENYSNDNLDNDKIIEAIDSIIEETKCDATRVYVSGFSMGSMRTWALTSNYSDKFAGAIAMCGFNMGMDENGSFKAEMPFYAISGKESYLAGFFEFPNAENYLQEAAILKANHVADEFTFDESAGTWGLKPDNTYTVEATDLPDLSIEVSQFADSDGNIMTAFASASSAGHEPLRAATADAWKFVSQFSRNADGTLTFTENK